MGEATHMQTPPHIFFKLSSHFGEPGSAIYAKVLQSLLSREEAEILLCLPAHVAEVAEKAGIPSSNVEATLEDLFVRGLVLRSPDENGRTKYALCGNVYDSVLWQIGARRARGDALSSEDLETLDLMAQFGTDICKNRPPKIPTMRVIPMDKMIPSENEILPYELLSRLIRETSVVSVAQCPCRVERRNCDSPTETCLVLGKPAEILVERGAARPIEVKEALQILERCEDLGLVHQTANASRQINVICNCCTCCCDFLRALTILGTENATARSRYHAAVDSELCNGCGVCENRCKFGAVELKGGVASASEERCFGCGLCVSKCPTEAIRLVLDKGEDHIPEREAWPPLPELPVHDVLLKILKEKGAPGLVGDLNRLSK